MVMLSRCSTTRCPRGPIPRLWWIASWLSLSAVRKNMNAHGTASGHHALPASSHEPSSHGSGCRHSTSPSVRLIRARSRHGTVRMAALAMAGRSCSVIDRILAARSDGIGGIQSGEVDLSREEGMKRAMRPPRRMRVTRVERGSARTSAYQPLISRMKPYIAPIRSRTCSGAVGS
jgi:hypothetical protein